MSQQVIAVREETLVNEIVILLAECQNKRAPVLRNDMLVGIVSRAGIVDAVTRGHKVVRDW